MRNKKAYAGGNAENVTRASAAPPRASSKSATANAAGLHATRRRRFQNAAEPFAQIFGLSRISNSLPRHTSSLDLMSSRNNRSAWLIAQHDAPQELCGRHLQACDTGSLDALRACAPSGFSGVHLRLLAMKRSTSTATIKYMVNEVGLKPSDALDVALGPRMVKVLLNLGADAARFTYFESDYFLRRSCMRVADDSRHAENFRRTVNLYPAMGIRVLRGARLPRRVEQWFDTVSATMFSGFMRDYGNVHMILCHQNFKHQVQAAKDAVIARRAARDAARRAAAIEPADDSSTDTDSSQGNMRASSARFLKTYVDYVKFLPVKLFVSDANADVRSAKRATEMMLAGGLSMVDVETFRHGIAAKARRTSTVRSKVQKNDLYLLVQRVVDTHEEGISKQVMQYL